MPDESPTDEIQDDSNQALNIFPGNWTIRNDQMFRAFDLSFSQNWNPSNFPWDQLDPKNFDQRERIAQAYWMAKLALRSEEHTSELQSRFDLVCRLLLEKKKKYESQIQY